MKQRSRDTCYCKGIIFALSDFFLGFFPSGITRRRDGDGGLAEQSPGRGRKRPNGVWVGGKAAGFNLRKCRFGQSPQLASYTWTHSTILSTLPNETGRKRKASVCPRNIFPWRLWTVQSVFLLRTLCHGIGVSLSDRRLLAEPTGPLHGPLKDPPRPWHTCLQSHYTKQRQAPGWQSWLSQCRYRGQHLTMKSKAAGRPDTSFH